MIGDRVFYDWSIDLLADYGEESQVVVGNCLSNILLCYEDQDTFNRGMVDQECWEYVHKNVPYFTLENGHPTGDYDFIGLYEILRKLVGDTVMWVLDEYRDDISAFHNNINIEDVYCVNYFNNHMLFRIVGT